MAGASPGTIRGAAAQPAPEGVNASEFGVAPNGSEDQSAAFGRMLQSAYERDLPVFLPPGTYLVSHLRLPTRTRLAGISGSTRIVARHGALFSARDADLIGISSLILDGALRWERSDAEGMLDLRGVRTLELRDCEILGAGANAMALEKVSGRIERSSIRGVSDTAIYCIDAGRLRVSDNDIADCGNGGILIHRRNPGDDGAIVTGNRIERIQARAGGTGQQGNGINVYRGDNVIIANNSVRDCAFSAIRANSASNVQITANSCLRSGETAVYSEFSFEGAIIANNVVDGAAHGISVVNFNEGGRLAICSGNLVRNLTTAGPYTPSAPGFGVGITVEADATVSGNVVENAPVFGMALGWGPFMRNVTATGNVIRQAGIGIAVSVVEGIGTAVIADNVIDGALRGAIVGHRWAEPATGDLAAGGRAPENIRVDGNRVS